jgi:hypothetical protein
VRPFPESGGKWQISIDGADEGPFWHDKEIYYKSEKNMMMMSAEVHTYENTLEVAELRELFKVPLSARVMTMTSDGQRFLLRFPVVEESVQPLTLISDWPAELNNN